MALVTRLLPCSAIVQHYPLRRHSSGPNPCTPCCHSLSFCACAEIVATELQACSVPELLRSGEEVGRLKSPRKATDIGSLLTNTPAGSPMSPSKQELPVSAGIFTHHTSTAGRMYGFVRVHMQLAAAFAYWLHCRATPMS